MTILQKIIASTLVCLMLASCSTTQKITVFGTPGTEIYTPGTPTQIGVIDNSGKVKIELESNAYYAYLQSKLPGANDIVPFALDYKKKTYLGNKITVGIGYTLAAIGAGTSLIGSIGMLAANSNGDEDVTDTMGGITAVGLGVGLVGCAIGGPASSRLDQVDHAYQFKYLSTQKTNNDLTFTRPVIEYATSENNVETLHKQKEEKTMEIPESSISTKRLVDKSTKSFKDYGAMIEGIYVGTGKLRLGDDVVERYSGIQVVLTRIDKDRVDVNVVEDNDNEFFSNPSTYEIVKNANNSYTLTHSDISKATIEIDKHKNAIYLHPRVNIDGDLYVLEISATLQQ